MPQLGSRLLNLSSNRIFPEPQAKAEADQARAIPTAPTSAAKSRARFMIRPLVLTAADHRRNALWGTVPTHPALAEISLAAFTRRSISGWLLSSRTGLRGSRSRSE